MYSFGSLLLALLSCVSVAQAASHIPRQGHNLHRGNGKRNSTSTELVARAPGETYQNARFSWFVTGLGACGNTNVPSDFIVALSVPMYGDGSHCGETITITVGGKTAQATVADKCQECPYTAVDLTKGLFDYFGGDGYIYGSWHFGAGPPSPPPPPPPPSTTSEAPKTTAPPPPPPPPTSTSSTTTKEKPTTTSTPPPPPPPTSTSRSSTSSSSSTSATSTSSSTTTSTAVSTSSIQPSSSDSATSSASSSIPSATPSSGVLGDANQIVLQFANLAVMAAQS